MEELELYLQEQEEKWGKDFVWSKIQNYSGTYYTILSPDSSTVEYLNGSYNVVHASTMGEMFVIYFS